MVTFCVFCVLFIIHFFMQMQAVCVSMCVIQTQREILTDELISYICSFVTFCVFWILKENFYILVYLV